MRICLAPLSKGKEPIIKQALERILLQDPEREERTCS
jgi:hypothetical protein